MYRVLRAILFSTILVISISPQSLAQKASELKVEERKSVLESLHKRLYALPLSQDFIYEQLMPAVREERKHVAPNFPVRGATEADTERNVRQWLTDHPEELDAYSRFIEGKISQYATRNNRK